MNSCSSTPQELVRAMTRHVDCPKLHEPFTADTYISIVAIIEDMYSITRVTSSSLVTSSFSTNTS